MTSKLSIIGAMSPIDCARRKALLALPAAFMCACSTSPTLDLIGRTITARSHPQGRYPMTDEQLRALPYATLGVQVGAAAPSVMVLSRKESDLLYWVSADHVIFVTSYGRLVRTQGLKRDLVATDWKGVDPLAAAPGQSPDPDGLADIQRQLKIGVNHGETVWVSSSFQEVGDETLPSFNGTLTARRIIERVDVADWRWRTENMFWIADSGSVVKSRQQFCPEIPPITLELLKRPSNAA